MSIAGPEPMPHAGRGDTLLKGHHVLAMLVAFFAMVLAVNGYFLYSALRTYTGIVAVEPYRKGLAYNARIAAGERQTGLGWRDATTISRDGRISAAITDGNGAPVTGLDVRGVLGRPSTDADDRRLLHREADPGQFVAEAGALASGTWLLTIEARMSAGDAEPVYRARRRLWLQP